MSVGPGTLDMVLFIAVALVSAVLEWKIFYPALVRSSAAGRPGARSRYYAGGIAWLWALTACVLALWIVRARAWAALGLAPLAGARLAIAIAVAAGSVALVLVQTRSMLAGNLERVRAQFEGAEPMIPRTASERAGFAALSVTAGICEEILFRGFVAWYLAAWVGPVPAYALSILLFGFAHVYLGRDGAITAAVLGTLFTCIVVLTGSLLPAIVLHIARDLSAGAIGYRLMAGEPAKADASALSTRPSAVP